MIRFALGSLSLGVLLLLGCCARTQVMFTEPPVVRVEVSPRQASSELALQEAWPTPREYARRHPPRVAKTIGPEDPQRAKTHFERGKAHYEQFRYPEAALEFRSAELLDANNPEMHHYRLMAELLASERVAEFKTLEERLPLNPAEDPPSGSGASPPTQSGGRHGGYQDRR
jgi:hypothetical protein